ncbi:MAG: DUF1385 domain-containing protein [Candidatus Limnocylindrus sp.]
MRRHCGVVARRTSHLIALALAAVAAPTRTLAYGGQALVDGILMRGPMHIGVAIRVPNGSILTTSEQLPNGRLRQLAARLPIARGVVILVETLILGSRWLMRSAEISSGQASIGVKSSRSDRAISGVTVLLTFVFVIALFNIVPALGASFALGAAGVDSLLAERALDGVLQIGVLLAYLSLAGRSRDIDRTYRYHGAEHRAIHALENGGALTRAELARWPTAHPRCGTEFLVVVILVSLVSFSLLGRLDALATVVSRVIGIPLVAGVSYEILRLLGKYRTNPIARAFAAPGLAVQRITTRKPDDEMHDVAIAALTVAVEADGGSAPAGSERPTWGSLREEAPHG